MDPTMSANTRCGRWQFQILLAGAELVLALRLFEKIGYFFNYAVHQRSNHHALVIRLSLFDKLNVRNSHGRHLSQLQYPKPLAAFQL